MREIHPEVLITLGCDTSEVARTWHKVCAGDLLQLYGTKVGVKAGDQDPDKVWIGQLSLHFAWMKNFAARQKMTQEAMIAHLSSAFIPPFKTMVNAFTYPYSYHMLTRTKEFTEMAYVILQAFKKDNADSSFMNALHTQFIASFSAVTWEKAGKKTYTVTSKLAEALKATKLSQYPADNLRSPAPSIYVEFPPDKFTFTTYSDSVIPDSTGHMTLPVEGAYILEDTSPMGLRLWRVVVVCTNANKVLPNAHITHFYIPLRQNESINQCINSAEKMMRGEETCVITLPYGAGESTIGAGNPGNACWDKCIIDSAKEIFKFLMNIVLYVTRSDADTTFVHVSPEYESYKERMLKAQGKKREELKLRMRSMNPGVRVLLGKNYTIKRWDDKTASQHSEGGRHITVRTLVSGHWRNQACGVGKLEHKTIWIEPFWRGPEAAPLTEKRAVVK